MADRNDIPFVMGMGFDIHEYGRQEYFAPNNEKQHSFKHLYLKAND